MNYFKFSKNDGADFVLSEKDFINHTETLMTLINQKLGNNGRLPDKVDDTEFMMLDEFNELLEYYFTFKLLAREYDLETPEQLERVADFISELILLGVC